MNNDITFASKTRSLDAGLVFDIKKPSTRKSPSGSTRKSPSLIDGSGMASLGLFSLIAACGSDSGGSGTTGPTDTGAVGADGSTTYEASSLDSDAADDAVTAAFINHKVKQLAKISATGNAILVKDDTITYSYVQPSDNKKTFTVFDKADTTKQLTVSSPSDIFMSYGDISGKGTGDVAIISSNASNGTKLNAGSIDIIWNYPAQITDATKTYNVGGDKAGINHLAILGDENDKLTDDFHRFRFYSAELDDDKQVLVFSDSDTATSAPRDMFLVWDIGSYTNTSDTIDLTHLASTDTSEKTAISQKVLHITDAIASSDPTSDLIRFANVDNNDKKDLILLYGGSIGSLHVGVIIVWDIADYAPGGSKAGRAFDFSATALDRLSAGNESIDGIFMLNNFSSHIGFDYYDEAKVIDIDNDGLNDLIIRTGSFKYDFVFWGSQIFDEAGQGRSDALDIFKEGEYDGTIDVLGNVGVFDHKVGDYEKVGLAFSSGSWHSETGGKTRGFSHVHANFWLADVNGDGIRDAVSRTATDGSYKFWSLSTKLNIIPIATVNYDFYDENKDNGDGTTGGEKVAAGTKTAAELLKYGLLITAADKAKYIKKDVNGDGLYELIERAPIAAGEDHEGSHKVWFKGKKFDDQRLVDITDDADKIFKVDGEADAYLKVGAADLGALADNVFYTDVVDLA